MNLDLSAILAKHENDPTRLVAILHDVMAIAGAVTPPVITELAKRLGVSRGQVEGVVGFYSFFSTEPRGKFRVLFSDNITDEMAGSHELCQRLLDAFRVELGEVSRDGLVSIDRTSCTGLCDQGPAMLVSDSPENVAVRHGLPRSRAIARLTPARIAASGGCGRLLHDASSVHHALATVCRVTAPLASRSWITWKPSNSG